MRTSLVPATPALLPAIPAAAMSNPEPKPLLFCPFCRECYEGQTECPEHELALVPFHKLPREEDPEAPPPYDQRLGPFDPRFGRGLIMGGIVLSLVGFLMPLLQLATSTQSREWSGLEIAASRAPNLWTIPFVAATFAWFLARRRTPIAMQGARLAGVVVALAPLVSLAYTLVRIHIHVAHLVERTGRAMSVSLEYGVVVIALGALLLFVGSLRFGVLPAPRGAPFGEPDGSSPIEGRRPR
jgi:hypothetical protein